MYLQRCAGSATLVCTILLFAHDAPADFESPSSGATMQSDSDGGRPWDLSIRAFIGHNNNVQLVPDTTFFTGGNESVYTGVTIKGAYRIIEDREWTVGFTGQLEQLFYLNNDAGGGGRINDYNLFTLTPGVFVVRRYELFGLPASTQASYQFRFEEGKDVAAIGLESHTITTITAVMVQPDLQVTVTSVYGWDDFDVTFPAPGLNDRDADRRAISVAGKYWWDERRRNVSLTYTVAENDSEGQNFDYDSEGINARFETHVQGPLWMAIETGYRHGVYRGFISGFVPPPGRREQDAYHVGVQGIWVISRVVSVDAFYRFEQYDSNTSQFESTVHNAGGGITFRF